jgi:hypothetical protein
MSKQPEHKRSGGRASANATLPPLIDRVERALVLLACLIELDGDVHVPMFEKFEAELHELRRRNDTKERARKLLEAYNSFGGTNAILSRNLSFSSNDGPRP